MEHNIEIIPTFCQNALFMPYSTLRTKHTFHQYCPNTALSRSMYLQVWQYYSLIKTIKSLRSY